MPIQGKNVMFDSEVLSSRKELIYTEVLTYLSLSFIQNLPLFSAEIFGTLIQKHYFLQLLVFWNWSHEFQTYNVIDFFFISTSR